MNEMIVGQGLFLSRLGRDLHELVLWSDAQHSLTVVAQSEAHPSIVEHLRWGPFRRAQEGRVLSPCALSGFEEDHSLSVRRKTRSNRVVEPGKIAFLLSCRSQPVNFAAPIFARHQNT